MKMRGSWRGFVAAVLLTALGCSANFSPQDVRYEIERQTGQKPNASFEFKLDGDAMQFAKAVVSSVAGEVANFGGLERIDLAVFELPSGKRLDFGQVPIRGWDKLIQTSEDKGSLMVLGRTNGDVLRDMVLLAQGKDQVLYGRLTGKLDHDLPAALQRVLIAQGLQGLKEHLLSAAGGRK